MSHLVPRVLLLSGRMKSLLSLLVVIFVFYTAAVDAHGYLSSPRSRNWVAAEDGVNSPASGLPNREYCPHCLNINPAGGICGRSSYNNFDEWVDSTGANKIAWNSEETYKAGQIITVKSHLSTHHNGHMELFACPDGDASTLACFNKPEHALTFVSDVKYSMPADPDYPERGYYYGGQGGSVKNFEMQFRLPPSIVGDQVMLYWKYVTANSCSPPGYASYFKRNSLPSSFWSVGVISCTPPFPSTGALSTTWPEQFFNCAEVTVEPSTPTLSPQPSEKPVAVSPSSSAPPTMKTTSPWGAPSGIGCCTQDFGVCITWCGSTRDTCEGCNQDVFRLEGGAPPGGCASRYRECTSDATNCCPGLSCIGNEFYKQCKYVGEALGPTGAAGPGSPPTLTGSPEGGGGSGCCTSNFKECASWCGTTQQSCEGCSHDVFWLPGGLPSSGCNGRWEACTANPGICCPGLACVGDQFYSQCIYDPTSLPAGPSGNPPMVPTIGAQPAPQPAIAPVSTLPSSRCNGRWEECTTNPTMCCPGLACLGGQFYRQCMHDPKPSAIPPISPPVGPTIAEQPTPKLAPVSIPTPVPPVPVPPSVPEQPIPSTDPTPPREFVNKLYNTDKALSTWEVFKLLRVLRYTLSEDPPIYAYTAGGGAAGDGNVVTESQAYGLLITGIVLASWDTHKGLHGDAERAEVLTNFEGYFNGWVRMCQNSAVASSCQGEYEDLICEESSGRRSVCLPGWKHTGDLSGELGTGGASDGDEDAIVGMIFALKAVENDSPRPAWYDEVRSRADASATAFLKYNTIIRQDRRIVKLGSCWGGWDDAGQNPSYHSPGSYRIMRDFQEGIIDRPYTLPDFGGPPKTLTDQWNSLIDTTYDVLAVTQCKDVGMVPNWALVTVDSNQNVLNFAGEFSGSGTPQNEFGEEASRTVWRVAFDAAVFPDEMEGDSAKFMDPLLATLRDGFRPNFSLNQRFWDTESFEACFPDGFSSQVTAYSSGWTFNSFIFAPVISSLVIPSKSIPDVSQQEMIDKAGRALSFDISSDYYHRSWTVLSILMVNGAIESAGSLLRAPSAPINPLPSTPTPTKPYDTASILTTGDSCCSDNFKRCIFWPCIGCNDDAASCKSAGYFWLPLGPPVNQDSCIAITYSCVGHSPKPCCPGMECKDGNGPCVALTSTTSFSAPPPVFCFSGRTVVEVEGRGEVLMRKLELRDSVLVGNKKYERIYAFGHHSVYRSGEFLQILPSKLEVSKDHIVFIESRGAIPASMIVVGDKVVTSTGDIVTVEAIREVTSAGLFAPFTPSGTIVVNNILASTYVSFENKSSLTIAGIEVSFQFLAHMSQYPHRVICHYFGHCKGEYTHDGVSTMVTPGLAHWILHQSWAVQNIVLSVLLFVFSLFWLLENAAGAMIAIALIFLGIVGTKGAFWRRKRKID